MESIMNVFDIKNKLTRCMLSLEKFNEHAFCLYILYILYEFHQERIY